MASSKKFLDTIREKNMIQSGGTVLCCVSGGADSMALLSMFIENQENLGVNIRVCHVNHLLRGEESERDQAFVERFCKENNIHLDILRVNVADEAKNRKMSVELAAREIRYGYFEELSQKYNSMIATAHTLSDNVETILFNLTRGTGIEGLLGIPDTRQKIIRPLILYERREIEAYLTGKSISYVNDSTNSQTIYNRNKIRHEVLPKLREINPCVDYSINETSLQLFYINDFVKKYVKDIEKDFYLDGKYLINRLCDVHIAVRREIICNSLEQNKLSFSSRTVKHIEEIILNKSGKINISSDWYAIADENFYRVEQIQKKIMSDEFEHCAIIGEHFLYNGKVIKIEHCKEGLYKNLENVHASYAKNMLDYDKIVGHIKYRNRRAGDTVKLFGRGVSKSIKKLFNESKIPTHKRDDIVMLCDDSGILWVEGFGVSDHVSCGDCTKRALKIDVII